MKCPRCQTPAPNGANFCGICGAPIGAAQNSTDPLTSLSDASPGGGGAMDPAEMGPTLIGAPVILMEDVQAFDPNAATAPGDIEVACAPTDPPESDLDRTVQQAAFAEPEPARPHGARPKVAPAPDPTSTPSVIVDSSIKREVVRAEPAAKAAPKPAAKAAPKPAARPAPKPAAKAAPKPAREAADRPASQSKAPAGKPGGKPGGKPAGEPDGKNGFRETIWFMESINPDALEAIESDEDDLALVQDKYKDHDIAADERARFSLNVEHEAPSGAQMNRALRKLDSGGASGAHPARVLLAVIAVLGALAGAAYYLFFAAR